MMRLARPLRPPETIRTGQNPTTADTSGALNRAARSGCRTAQFLGTASAKTKITTISKTVAATTPQAPNHRTARMPDQGGHHQLADQHQQEDRVEEALGVLGEAHQHLRPPLAVVGQALGLGPSGADERRLGQRQQRRGGQQDHDDDGQDDVLGGERRGRGEIRHSAAAGSSSGADPVEAVEQLLLAALHPLGLLVDLVVHAQEVQDPVDHQQGDLVVEGHAVLHGVDGGDGRADDHVAQQQVPARSVPRWRRGPSLPRPGTGRSGRSRPRWGTTGRPSGPALSRKRSLRAAMDGSSMKSSDTSVSAVIPSASRTARASAAQRSTATGWSDCSSAA